MCNVEVPGSNTGLNAGKLYSCTFFPEVTVLLEYPNPVIYSCLVFAL